MNLIKLFLKKARYLIFLNLFILSVKAFKNNTLQIYFEINFIEALPY